MNIFALDSDPVRAAEYMCDKHVVKMALETAQLLCTALAQHGAEELPYKPTHRNHPCTIWAAESRANFLWLAEHGDAICREYSKRYGGREHKSRAVIVRAAEQSAKIPERSLTRFAQAMPDQYKNADPVAAYRAYYIGDKARFASWRAPAVVPDWWRAEA
jgi:hypothetical protein